MHPASTVFGLLLLLTALTFPLDAQTPSVLRLDLNGQEIHYIEKGTGQPLILLHGGLFDYRSWEPQFHEFAKNYRVISYSRRYSFPNNNVLDSRYRPAISDAEDLKNLIDKLGLKSVHLVGLFIWCVKRSHLRGQEF